MPQRVGLANNTRWRELRAHMIGLGHRAPRWRTHDRNGTIYGWDGDWYHHFYSPEGYDSIDVCELTPGRHVESIGLDECIAICRNIGFQLEVLPDVQIVRIIGYAYAT